MFAGYLQKRNAPVSPPPMQKVYSVLWGTLLMDFESEAEAQSSMTPRGCMEVLGVSEWDGKGRATHYPFGFLLVTHTGGTYYVSVPTQQERDTWVLNLKRGLECVFANPEVAPFKPSKILQNRPPLGPPLHQLSAHQVAQMRCPRTGAALSRSNATFCKACARGFAGAEHVSESATMLQIGAEEAEKVCTDCRDCQAVVLWLKSLNYVHAMALHELTPAVLQDVARFKASFKWRRRLSHRLEQASDLLSEGAISAAEFEELRSVDHAYRREITHEESERLKQAVDAFGDDMQTVVDVLLNASLVDKGGRASYYSIVLKVLEIADHAPDLVDFYLPQLLQVHLSLAAQRSELALVKVDLLQQALLVMSQKYPALGLKLTWSLLASGSDYKEGRNCSQTQYAACTALLLQLEMVLTGGFVSCIVDVPSCRRLAQVLRGSLHQQQELGYELGALFLVRRRLQEVLDEEEQDRLRRTSSALLQRSINSSSLALLREMGMSLPPEEQEEEQQKQQQQSGAAGGVEGAGGVEIGGKEISIDGGEDRADSGPDSRPSTGVGTKDEAGSPTQLNSSDRSAQASAAAEKLVKVSSGKSGEGPSCLELLYQLGVGQAERRPADSDSDSLSDDDASVVERYGEEGGEGAIKVSSTTPTHPATPSGEAEGNANAASTTSPKAEKETEGEACPDSKSRRRQRRRWHRRVQDRQDGQDGQDGQVEEEMRYPYGGWRSLAQQVDFVEKVNDLVERLRFVDRAKRTEALRLEVETWNADPDSSLGWDLTSVAGEPFYKIMRVVSEECRVFRTKARAPSLLVCEVLRDDLVPYYQDAGFRQHALARVQAARVREEQMQEQRLMRELAHTDDAPGTNAAATTDTTTPAQCSHSKRISTNAGVGERQHNTAAADMPQPQTADAVPHNGGPDEALKDVFQKPLRRGEAVVTSPPSLTRAISPPSAVVRSSHHSVVAVAHRQRLHSFEKEELGQQGPGGADSDRFAPRHEYLQTDEEYKLSSQAQDQVQGQAGSSSPQGTLGKSSPTDSSPPRELNTAPTSTPSDAASASATCSSGSAGGGNAGGGAGGGGNCVGGGQNVTESEIISAVARSIHDVDSLLSDSHSKSRLAEAYRANLRAQKEREQLEQERRKQRRQQQQLEQLEEEERRDDADDSEGLAEIEAGVEALDEIGGLTDGRRIWVAGGATRAIPRRPISSVLSMHRLSISAEDIIRGSSGGGSNSGRMSPKLPVADSLQPENVSFANNAVNSEDGRGHLHYGDSSGALAPQGQGLDIADRGSIGGGGGGGGVSAGCYGLDHSASLQRVQSSAQRLLSAGQIDAVEYEKLLQSDQQFRAATAREEDAIARSRVEDAFGEAWDTKRKRILGDKLDMFGFVVPPRPQQPSLKGQLEYDAGGGGFSSGNAYFRSGGEGGGWEPSPEELEWPAWDLRSYIMKTNDDLRQEVCCLQLMQIFKEIFEHFGLSDLLWLCPYRIVSTGSSTGLVEVLQDAISLDALKKTAGFTSLSNYFKKTYATSPERLYRAKRNFAASLAAYSLFSYLLLIKDRHNGNLLLDAEGHLLHIDFGFLLSIAPGGSFSVETAPFKLTEEMVELLGGLDAPLFGEFVTAFTKGFIALQANAENVISALQVLARQSPFPCFQGARSPQPIIDKLRARFRTELSVADSVKHCLDLITGSYGHYGTRQYDTFQWYTNGIMP